MLVRGTPIYAQKKICLKLHSNSCQHLKCYYRTQRSIDLSYIHVLHGKNTYNLLLSKGFYDVDMWQEIKGTCRLRIKHINFRSFCKDVYFQSKQMESHYQMENLIRWGKGPTFINQLILTSTVSPTSISSSSNSSSISSDIFLCHELKSTTNNTRREQDS